MNVAVVEGRLSRPAELRVLPSGDQLVALEVTVAGPSSAGHGAAGRSESVPVVWPGAPQWAVTLEAGAGVLVLGRVRRRYFRAGGSTQSRTEIVAERIAPVGQARRARALLERAAALLADAVDTR